MLEPRPDGSSIGDGTYRPCFRIGFLQKPVWAGTCPVVSRCGDQSRRCSRGRFPYCQAGSLVMSRPGVNVIGFVCRVACGRRLGRAIKRSSLFRLELLTDHETGIHIRATARRSWAIASYIGEVTRDGRAMAPEIRAIGIYSREIATDIQATPANTRATGGYNRRTAPRNRAIAANPPLPMICAFPQGPRLHSGNSSGFHTSPPAVPVARSGNRERIRAISAGLLRMAMKGTCPLRSLRYVILGTGRSARRAIGTHPSSRIRAKGPRPSDGRGWSTGRVRGCCARASSGQARVIFPNAPRAAHSRPRTAGSGPRYAHP